MVNSAQTKSTRKNKATDLRSTALRIVVATPFLVQPSRSVAAGRPSLERSSATSTGVGDEPAVTSTCRPVRLAIASAARRIRSRDALSGPVTPRDPDADDADRRGGLGGVLAAEQVGLQQPDPGLQRRQQRGRGDQVARGVAVGRERPAAPPSICASGAWKGSSALAAPASLLGSNVPTTLVMV